MAYSKSGNCYCLCFISAEQPCLRLIYHLASEIRRRGISGRVEGHCGGGGCRSTIGRVEGSPLIGPRGRWKSRFASIRRAKAIG